jgi:gentisate 1,2-dioxygenase
MDILKPHDAQGEFFKVLGTTDKSQVATMTLRRGQDSGEGDLHAGDQIVYVLEGVLRVVVKDEEARLEHGEAVIIPAGTPHRLYTAGEGDAFLLNVYSAPEY